MRGRSAKLCVMLVSGLGSVKALAEEQSRLLESVRFKARGDTYVAAYDSDEATRANPASLAQGKVNFQFRGAQVDGFIGENSLKTISDLTNLAQDTTSSATSVLQTFTSRFGKRQYLRLQGNLFSLRIKSFEISPFASSNAFVDMRIPTTPNLELKVDAAAGVNVATGFTLSQTMELGINLKYLSRTVIEGEAAFSQVLDMVDSSSTTLTDTFQKREGTQLGTDIGLIWHPTKEHRYGLLVENVGFGTNLSTGSSLPLPLLRQRVNLGWLYRADRNPWHWDFLVDAQDVVNPQTLDPLRQLHLGLEFGRSFFSRDHDFGLQLGLSEGYLTYGAFLDLWAFRLNVAYYAAELGEYAGQRKDRRWGLSLQVLTVTF